MKYTMKLLSVLLSICMVLGMLPVTAFATEELCYTVTIGGEITNYTDIGEAIDTACAAKAATLTLHQDITEYDGMLNFYAGDVTLDLNGWTIAKRITLEECTLTVKDSATVKGTVINASGCAFYYYSGKLIIEDSVDAYGEAEGHEPWIIASDAAPENTVTIGCTGTEHIVLPENCAVVDYDGYKYDEYDILPSDKSLFFHRHVWSEATCTEPKVCSRCLKVECEALGHDYNEAGACLVCGHDPSKLITINMTDSWGDGWNGNTIKIYENGQELSSVTLEAGTEGSWTGDYDSSKVYVFKWAKGDCAEECGFEVVVVGETVYTATTDICAAFTDGEQFYSLCEHNYGDGTVTPPTCTEDGFTTYTCTICNGDVVEDVVPSTGHSFGSDGACLVCGHDPSKLITINMTDSWGDGWNGNTIKIYENGQELSSVTLEAGTEGSWTGDYDSSKVYVFKWAKGDCAEECGFEVVVVGETVYTATTDICAAFTDGEQFYSLCEHNYGDGTVTPPTCTEDGFTTYTCTICNGDVVEDVVPSTGHSFGSDGACLVCGHDPSKLITINMTDSWGDGWNGNTIKIYENGQELSSVTLEAGTEGSWTGDYDSSKVYVFKWAKGDFAEECSFVIVICEEVVFTALNEDCGSFGDGQQIYPICEHTIEKGETVAPTCTENGFTTYTCTLCGGTWEEDFEQALGHTLGDAEPAFTAPTCTEIGYYTYICGRCETAYDDNYVAILGHTLGADGNCTVCGEFYSVPVAVAGTDIDADNLSDVFGDGTVSYDPETNTLTLKDFTYNGTDYGIWSQIGLNIELIGNNKVYTEIGLFFGITESNIYIGGTGTLDLQTGCEAIMVSAEGNGKLTIGGGVKLLIDTNNDEGIYMYGDSMELVLKDRAVVQMGSEDAPIAEEGIYMIGDIDNKMTITDHAAFSCATSDEEGIYVAGDLTISGAPTVDVIADENAIDVDDLNISGGNITAIGGSGYGAIEADELNISGGAVTVDTEDEVLGEGIVCGVVTITGGELTVLSGGMIADNFENDSIALGEGMAIIEPIGATIGDATFEDRSVKTVLENDGTVAESFIIGKADEVQKLDIDASRMILGNALEFQFGIAQTKLPDITGCYAVIEKTWADGTTTEKTIPATQWGVAGPYWAIVYEGLAAKEMGDTFYVTIYNADGVAISNAKVDSVRDYVARAYASQNATGKTMLVDMLNYGAAAQVHFNYDTDELCNNELTDEQKAVGTAEVATLNNNQVKGDNYLYTRLSLESRIQLQLAFKGLTSDMYAIYSYTDNNGATKEVRVDGADFVDAGGVYGVELSALVYADARADVVVTVYNADGTVYGSATESIESYAARSSTGDDVYTALMKFADSAKAYLY